MKYREAAVDALLRAWNSEKAIPLQQARVGHEAFQICVELEDDSAIAMGIQMLELLPKLNIRYIHQHDQQYILTSFSGVTSTLCSLLLAANRLNDAIQYLEQGRTAIISRLLDGHADLSDLEHLHPDLAEEYQRLVKDASAPLQDQEFNIMEDAHLARRNNLIHELDGCLSAIRDLPGHERFLLGQTIADMQACANGGTIVIVNITELRSDAILVSSQTLTAITLPQLLASDAKSWLSREWTVRKKSQALEKNKLFLEYLSWLWNNCVKQIIEKVSPVQADHGPHDGKLPRVWWIGSGLASSMPFHAAGIHGKTSVENAYSKIISSYTPSIKALAHSRSQSKAQKGNTDSGMFIAIMPTSPEGPTGQRAPKPLHGVIEEKDEILKLTHGRINTKLLSHPSSEEVLVTLQDCRIAHLACHGISDNSDPSKSALILQKCEGPGEPVKQDRLTVLSISKLQLAEAQIAYLSACSTAENKVQKLSDEVIHLVSGFQVAGFPHVVGCLWPAGDTECVEVAKNFYSQVLKGNDIDCNNVAYHLQQAVEKVRKEEITMPLKWAQFVHYGA